MSLVSSEKPGMSWWYGKRSASASTPSPSSSSASLILAVKERADLQLLFVVLDVSRLSALSIGRQPARQATRQHVEDHQANQGGSEGGHRGGGRPPGLVVDILLLAQPIDLLADQT